MHWIGRTHNFHRTLKEKDELRHLPEVEAALANIARGGIPEAIIRMLILVAEGRGGVRGSRVERSAYAFSHAKPFADIDAEQRARIMREQTLIVQFDRDRAIATLTDLLPDMDSRAIAEAIVEHVVGPGEHPQDPAIEMLEVLRRALGLRSLRLGDTVTDEPETDRKADKPTNEAA
jgi:hypothetical protein